MTLSFNECDHLVVGKEPVECFAIDRMRALLFRTFLAPTSFVAAVMWTIWAQAAEPITVLAPFNLTGPQAALGVPCYNGAELAVENLNAAGGVLGRRIKFIPIDTASEVSRTTDAL